MPEHVCILILNFSFYVQKARTKMPHQIQQTPVTSENRVNYPSICILVHAHETL